MRQTLHFASKKRKLRKNESKVFRVKIPQCKVTKCNTYKNSLSFTIISLQFSKKFYYTVDLEQSKKRKTRYPRCDYRADGISCFFFFRLYKIYKLEFCLFFRCLCYLYDFFKRSSSCCNYCCCNRSFCNRTINHLDLAVFHRF